jgi:hypothetical protein
MTWALAWGVKEAFYHLTRPNHELKDPELANLKATRQWIEMNCIEGNTPLADDEEVFSRSSPSFSSPLESSERQSFSLTPLASECKPSLSCLNSSVTEIKMP